MMKKMIFFLIAGLIIQSKLNAQATYAELENQKVMYPSPTAASLGKYGEYPVSLYNGLVNIGQDIVTVKSGRLALDVSLSYHASGNKPSDIPGWVGLGFSLNAGGVITRVIKDLPDDLTGGFYNSNTTVQSLWTTYRDTHFIERYYEGTIDPRSDVYQFNFGGKTGEFVFDWDRNIHFKQKVPFKVQIIGGAGGFGGFVITTDDGVEYTFDRTERSQLSVSSATAPTTSWYLTKIKNLSGDIIVLKYTEPTGKYRYKQYNSRKEVYGTISGGVLEPTPTVRQTTSMDEVVYLDEIDFNNGKLVFNKSARTDPYLIPAGVTAGNVEEKKLDMIVLKDNNDNVIRQWKFEYFENNTERLKLKSLIAQASDQTSVQKYSFEYNSIKLPVALSGPNAINPYASNDIDYWGYYNGAANNDNRIPKMFISDVNAYMGSADRSINPSLIKAEMLEKMTYPTGGYAMFTYEPNDYSVQGVSFAAAQNPMIIRTPATESYEFSYSRDDGGFDVDPATLSFTLTETTHVYIRYVCGADGPLHAWGEPGVTHEQDLMMTVGTHTLQNILNTSAITSSANADITNVHAWVTVYKEGEPVILTAKTGPGLRIKAIATSDGMSTTTRNFEYKLGNSQNATASSGFLSVFPAFYASLQAFAATISGQYLTSDPINDITDGPPVGYSRVVERFQNNSYTVHYYTSYDDHPDDIMEFTNGYSDTRLAHMSSNDFWRGLETSTEYYNTDGTIQKRNSNSYEVLPESITNVQAIELKPTVGFTASPDIPVNYVNTTLISLYYVKSCFLYNRYHQEEVFDKNGANPVMTSVLKSYNNVTHLQPTLIQTSGSNGSVLTTATSFPNDFARGTAFINYMQDNHFTSFPIEQVVYRERGGVNNIVSGNIITYKTEGAALPEQLLKLETASPVAQANFKFANRAVGVLPPSSLPSVYSPDAHYQPALMYTLYDSKGNALETVKRNGIKTAYVWGYNQTLPVAEIIGSDYTTAIGKIDNPSIVTSPSSDPALRTELNKLRTGLAGAMVTTYTYAPLTGATSQTDPSGKTVYYEYDSFGRLKLIRDQSNAIIKKFDYKYNGQ